MLKKAKKKMQKSMHKKEQAIVMGVTGNWSFAVANVLIGIKKYSFQLIDKTDFIVLEQGLSEKDKELLNSIIPCLFIEYNFPRLDELKKRHSDNYKRFTEMTYSRFECFNMLNEYKKVVWLDVDILVQDDISKIFSYGEKTGIAFCKEADNIDWLFNDKTKVDKYDLNQPSVNAGVFVISDKLQNYKNITDWCYEKTIELCSYLFLVDQSILNIMFQEFNLEIEPIDSKFNCYLPYKSKKEIKNASIIHTCDYKKYWNYHNSKEWNDNNKEWVKMGGTRFTGKKINKIYDYLYKKIYCPIAHNRPDPIRHPRKFIKCILTGN